MMKFLRGKLVILVLLGLFLASSSQAGVILRIYPGAIKDKDGGSPADPSVGSNLEFFYPSLPADPRSTTNTTTLSLTEVRDSGRLLYYQYENMSLSGGTLWARAWKNGIRVQGAYYSKNSYGVTPSHIPPTPVNVTDIRTIYKADVPYRPSIGTIEEAMVRQGDVLVLTLKIPVNYSQDGSDGKREITGLSLRITYPDGSTETRDGASITLSDVPSGTYRFKPIATNWFGNTEGTEMPYTTLGIGAAGPETVTINFLKPTGDLGVNPFGYPFASVISPEAISSLKQLIQAVNAQAGANVVTVAGWWIKETQEPAGYIISYNSDSVNDFKSFLTVGDVPADPADHALVKDTAYQLSVLREAAVTLTGTR